MFNLTWEDIKHNTPLKTLICAHSTGAANKGNSVDKPTNDMQDTTKFINVGCSLYFDLTEVNRFLNKSLEPTEDVQLCKTCRNAFNVCDAEHKDCLTLKQANTLALNEGVVVIQEKTYRMTGKAKEQDHYRSVWDW